jgi:hypothetical protein
MLLPPDPSVPVGREGFDGGPSLDAGASEEVLREVRPLTPEDHGQRAADEQDLPPLVTQRLGDGRTR